MPERITLRINPEVHSWFQKVCQEGGTKMSTIIREFIQLLYGLRKEAVNGERKESQKG